MTTGTPSTTRTRHSPILSPQQEPDDEEEEEEEDDEEDEPLILGPNLRAKQKSRAVFPGTDVSRVLTTSEALMLKAAVHKSSKAKDDLLLGMMRK